MKKILGAAFTANKRNRVVSSEECKYDLVDILPLLFKAYHRAVELFYEEMPKTQPQYCVRGMKSSYFASKMIQSLSGIGLDVKHGKYGRKLLYESGYIILFKKFDRAGRPMNVKTKNNTAIKNQLAGNLFGCGEDGTAPILYFGYSVSRFGEICNPRLVYIDGERLKWAIEEDDLAAINTITEIVMEQPAGGVFIKPGVITAKNAE